MISAGIMLADIKAGTAADTLGWIDIDTLYPIFGGGDIGGDYGTDGNAAITAYAFLVGVD